MKNYAVHNPLSRFAFASIFQSAMNLKSWNAPPSVLPPEEEEEVLSDSIPRFMEELCRPKPMLYGAIPPMMCMRSIDFDQPRMMRFGACNGGMDSECMSDAVNYCSMPMPPPIAVPRMRRMDAMPSYRFIAQSADRMEDIDTYKKKKSVEHHYERLEKTKEYQEGYYYQSTEMVSPVSLVPNSAFWASFAHHLRSGSSCPFLSKDFILCTHSVSEVLFCLSVLGIQSEEAAYHLQKSQLVTNSLVFVFHKMLKEGTKPADCPLMVLTKYIDNSNHWNNHWKTVNRKKVEHFKETNEFVAGVSYTCMIVITNVAPIQQVVEIMYQIPRGSYPLSILKSLVNEVKTIDAFSTCTLGYSFVLFPEGGRL